MEGQWVTGVHIGTAGNEVHQQGLCGGALWGVVLLVIQVLAVSTPWIRTLDLPPVFHGRFKNALCCQSNATQEGNQGRR